MKINRIIINALSLMLLVGVTALILGAGLQMIGVL